MIKNQKLLAQIDFDQLYVDLETEGIEIKIGGSTGIPIKDAKLADLISFFIPYIYGIAGLVLFGLLIAGGFGFLTSAGDPDKVKGAQGKITSALVGFLIIFLSYWLVQILEVLFGIEIF